MFGPGFPTSALAEREPPGFQIFILNLASLAPDAEPSVLFDGSSLLELANRADVARRGQTSKSDLDLFGIEIDEDGTLIVSIMPLSVTKSTFGICPKKRAL